MKLSAAPMIIDILTACCVNGQGRESRTLSNPQRSQLSEIVSLSYQHETSDSEDDETDSCVSEIVDTADECFTKTAIPLVRVIIRTQTHTHMGAHTRIHDGDEPALSGS